MRRPGQPATLTTTTTWGGENNLIASTDARGNETDYAYDNMGNTLEVQLLYVHTNVGSSEFQENLMSNGFSVERQPAPNKWVLTNGTDRYALYTRTSTGGPGAQYFGGNGRIIKFSLGAMSRFAKVDWDVKYERY